MAQRHPIPAVIPGLLRRRDVATRLGISLTAVDTLERRGYLQAVRVPDLRITRYRTADVEALLGRWLREARETEAQS